MSSILFPNHTASEARELIGQCDDARVLFADAWAARRRIEPDLADSPLVAQASQVPFLGVIARAAQRAHRQFLAEAPRGPLANADEVLAGLTATVVQELHTLCCRTLAREMRDRSAAGRLAGDTPEARYLSFQEQLLQPEDFDAIDRAYPLLVPTMAQAAEQRFAHAASILEQLEQDADDLRGAGLLTADVKAVAMGAGDTHRGGRSVAILTLADGNRLVHKPRSLAVDVGFSRFVASVNAVAGTSLPTATVLTRDGHGWMGWLDPADPADAPSPERHFEQIGQLLAILVVLGATDMHHENLIPTALGPVIIDGETLLHPRVREPEGVAARNVRTHLEESVHAVGLLPLMISNKGHGVDVGVVGHRGGALSPFKSLVERNPLRDDLTYVLERLPMPAGFPPGPALPADGPGLMRTIARIQQGFHTVATAMARHRHMLRGRLLRHLGDVEVRHLNNQTSHYGQLLRMVTHPHFHLDAEFRRQGLWRVALTRPEPDALTAAECRDLARGDVPIFTARTGGRVLRSSDGAVVAELADTPVALAADRLMGLDASGIAHHLGQIQAAFVARFPSREPLAVAPTATVSPQSAAWRLARRVGDELIAGLHAPDTRGGPARWIGPLLNDDDTGWQPGIMADDLYTGIAGPALLLGAMAGLDAHPRWRTHARRVLDPLAGQLASGELIRSALPLGRLGHHTGVAGIHWTLAEAGDVAGEADWTAAAYAALPALTRAVAGQDRPDVIDGDPGLLLMAMRLMDLATTVPHLDAARALALTCIDNLERAHAALPLHGREPTYTGFAHGLAGNRAALAVAALRGLREPGRVDDDLAGTLDAMFDPVAGNWWVSQARDAHAEGWCHGAPGIALASVLVAEQEGRASEPDLRTLRAGADRILAHGIGRSSAWCHGDPGNVDILTRVAAVLDETALTRRTRDLEAQLVGDVLPRWLDAPSNQNRYASNLMLGTSGIGWYALRILDPDLPSPLSLL